MLTAPTADDACVTLIEVSPRDGLQNEDTLLSTADKRALIGRLAACGLERIEVTSFAHPKRVPQMADAERLCAQLPGVAGIRPAALVLNEHGYRRARSAGSLSEIALVVCASDAFSQRNQGIDVGESIRLAQRLTAEAHRDGLAVSISLSVAFGCPYSGEIAPEAVAGIAAELADAAPEELVLSDTIGVAVPLQVRRVIDAIQNRLAGRCPALRGHFHDTRNTAMANVLAAMASGLRRFDASLGGLGGCPFAPAAGGNVATEDLVYCLERCGWQTGVSLADLLQVVPWLEARLGRQLPGRVSRAGGFPDSRACGDGAACSRSGPEVTAKSTRHGAA